MHPSRPVIFLSIVATAVVGAGLAVLAIGWERGIAPPPGRTLPRSKPIVASRHAQSPGSLDEVVQSALDEVRRQPRSADACTALAVAYMRKQRESGDPAYYRRAEQAARQSLAWVEMGEHRFREARQLAERCTRLQPADYWNYGTLGDANVELGNYP